MAADFASIDPRFIDADFPAFDEYTFGDKGRGPLDRIATFSAYEDAVPVIPSSDWRGLAEEIQAAGGGLTRLVSRIYNQRSEGSCVANACSQAHECVQAKQHGKDRVVHLSAISLYKRIGRSPGSGAMVSDGLEEMARRGVLPLDTPENREKYQRVMPNTGFYADYPRDWEATAALFTATEWHIVRSVEGLITALLNQHPVVVGRQGHSICYCDVVYRDGDPSVVYANSWGDWGFGAGNFDKGFGLDTMGNIRRSAGWAFALRTVKPLED